MKLKGRVWWLLGVGVVLVLFARLVGSPTGDRDENLEPIVGRTWVQVERSVDGELMGRGRNDLYMVVTGDGLMQHHVRDEGVVLSGSTVVGQHLCRFSWKAGTAECDLSDRGDWSAVRRGIAELSGRRLRLCFAGEGESRPTVFETDGREGAGRVLFEFVAVE